MNKRKKMDKIEKTKAGYYAGQDHEGNCILCGSEIIEGVCTGCDTSLKDFEECPICNEITRHKNDCFCGDCVGFKQEFGSGFLVEVSGVKTVEVYSRILNRKCLLTWETLDNFNLLPISEQPTRLEIDVVYNVHHYLTKIKEQI